MSKDLLWELEKLRRQFGVDGKEIQAAAKSLDRKRRGAKPHSDDDHLAKLQSGVSARQIAARIGGPGAAAIEIRIARKNRKETLKLEYWKKMKELADILVRLSPSLPELDDYTKRLIESAGAPSAPHLIMLDLAMCNLQSVLDGNRLSTDDRDHVERARFYATMSGNSDLDTPTRFEKLGRRIDALEAILQELRAKIT